VGAAGTEVTDPVGQIDLAPTFCAIAGVPPAEWMQGAALPTADGAGTHQRVLCEWDSQFPGYGMHLRSIYRDGWLLTAYEESTDGHPNGLEKHWGEQVLLPCGVHYDGTEGELYRVDEDPHQWRNLWDDPGFAATKADLLADLHEGFDPLPRRVLDVEAPA
jgi:arylsulfatase A-like enzyme